MEAEPKPPIRVDLVPTTPKRSVRNPKKGTPSNWNEILPASPARNRLPSDPQPVTLPVSPSKGMPFFDNGPTSEPPGRISRATPREIRKSRVKSNSYADRGSVQEIHSPAERTSTTVATVHRAADNSTSTVVKKGQRQRRRKKRAAMNIDGFEVLNKVGEGGFGTVLLVRKKDNGKLYALKVGTLGLGLELELGLGFGFGLVGGS